MQSRIKPFSLEKLVLDLGVENDLPPYPCVGLLGCADDPTSIVAKSKTRAALSAISKSTSKLPVIFLCVVVFKDSKSWERIINKTGGASCSLIFTSADALCGYSNGMSLLLFGKYGK